MEQRITGREIVLFIAKFRLWDAYLDTGLSGDYIDLRAPGYGCEECSFTLWTNGKYTIEAWTDKDGHPGWEEVEQGDIYEVDRPKKFMKGAEL